MVCLYTEREDSCTCVMKSSNDQGFVVCAKYRQGGFLDNIIEGVVISQMRGMCRLGSEL